MSFCWPLGLKLSAHSDDRRAFEYYRSYVDPVSTDIFFHLFFHLTVISFRTVAILALLGSASSIDLREACDTPARPASRVRNRARSFSISSGGSSSTQMSRRLPSRRRSPIILRPPPNHPSVSDGSQRSDPDQGSVVSLPRESGGRAAPGWNQFWNPGRAWSPLFRRFRLTFSLDLSLSRRYLGLPLWTWLLVTATCVLELLSI